MNDNTSIKIARLITLEKKFRTAENLSELGFVCANELRSVVDYNFLFFLTKFKVVFPIDPVDPNITIFII